MDQFFSDASLRYYLAGGLLVVMALMLTLSVAIMVRSSRQMRSQRTIDRVLSMREGQPAADLTHSVGRVAAVASAAEQAGHRLESGRMGASLLAAEDRKLIEMAGFANAARARALFILLRFVCAAALPMAAWVGVGLYYPDLPLLWTVCAVFVGFAVGWMLPKWMLLRRVARRRRQAEAELPLLIDLVRLLQGVGLSVDQSLHVLVTDFRSVMPVLGHELYIATELYARGRTREQSLNRLSHGFDNDDLAAICRLIVQVDRHGGAVQQPLAQFSERVRERRKLDMKAHVAKLTVKMTGVMVLTLLPALLIVTGGSGFVALLRGLARVKGGM